MKAQATVKPRKSPKQERSQSLVGSVLEATTRILAVYGYAKISTNRVAALAGVSVGSLYQYFPGKEALVAAVLERQVMKMMDLFERDLKAQSHLNTPEGVRQLVTTTVNFYLENGRVTRELFNHAGALQRMSFVLSVRRRAVQLIADLIADRGLSSEPGKKAFVLVNAIMGVVLTSVMDEQAPLDRAALVDELTELSVVYLGLANRAL